MILRRLSAELRAQNWVTIAIELAIVIVGVFIGTQVSNWNETRLQRRQTARMLEQLRPELALDVDYFESVRAYFRVTKKYADIALAGWRRDPQISDAQFVISAYEASQIYGIGTNAQNWTLIFGGEQMRDIDDPTLRRHLSYVLTTDYSDVGLATMQTSYRTNVRLVIPNDIQVAIRATCGDRLIHDAMDQYVYILPDRCALSLDPAKAAAAAQALRGSGSLPNQLTLHLSSVESYLQNVDIIEIPMRTLERDLDKQS